MGKELIRYEGGIPVFTDAVADLASAMHPLLGLSRLAAKVHAWRLESKRLELGRLQETQAHQERMQINTLQVEAFERYAARTHDINLAQLALLRSQNDLAAHKIELDFDLSLKRIRLEGDLERFRIRAETAVAIKGIDAALVAALEELSIRRRYLEREAQGQRQRDMSIDRSRREIETALRNVTSLMSRDASMVEVCALTVGTLGSSLAAMSRDSEHPRVALLDALRMV